MPGLPVLFDAPFDMVGLVSVGMTCIITLLGIRYTPHSWFVGAAHDFQTTYRVFLKLVITFMIWNVRSFSRFARCRHACMHCTVAHPRHAC